MDELGKARDAANELADKSTAVAHTLHPMGSMGATADALRRLGVALQKFANAWQGLADITEPKYEEVIPSLGRGNFGVTEREIQRARDVIEGEDRLNPSGQGDAYYEEPNSPLT